MSHRPLGLFDTTPTRSENRFALLVIGLLFAAFLAILPVSGRPMGEVIAFVPVVNAVIFVGEVIIATLLYAQAAVFRSRALVLLASGFVFIALLLIPHALAFPGAFGSNGLLGDGTNTTAWVMIFRRLGFPLTVILYAVLMRAESRERPEAERPPASILTWLSGAVALAAVATALPSLRPDLLPPIFVNRSDVLYFNLLVFNLLNIGLLLLAMAMLLRKRRSVLDMWLLVALAGWLIQSLLNVPLHARFTLGWYCLFLSMLFAHLFLLVALIAESNRLYARLALSVAAYNRERETRLMSLDVVVAAISHEVGQPLSAVTLSVRSALNWLDRGRPDPKLAIDALNDAIDAGHRTFDVMRSMRTTFVRGSDSLSQLDLNDLARENLSLLERELAAQKISVHLELDEKLPLILADRIQIQRVLLNLLTNAVESVGALRQGARRVIVRSTPSGDRDVLLEITDSGVGIPHEAMPHIFDLFYTTKATGTGVGLSLSRIIVQEHGGRLWASSSEGDGATFHLQLPRDPGHVL